FAHSDSTEHVSSPHRQRSLSVQYHPLLIPFWLSIACRQRIIRGLDNAITATHVENWYSKHAAVISLRYTGGDSISPCLDSNVHGFPFSHCSVESPAKYNSRIVRNGILHCHHRLDPGTNQLRSQSSVVGIEVNRPPFAQ